ncbi:MAG: sensor histidine kinase [Planctomycetaceae bacterium]|nr:sensor histidine kinase [Planctomycetaceae bacterium]
MSASEMDQLKAENEELRQQLKSLEQQLIAAQKLGSVGELASSITHEFNNILTTIINYAKLGMRHKTEEMRAKAFDKILSAGQRAAKITTGMLSYARSKGDRREPMSLQQLLSDVLVLVEKDLQVHRIETRIEQQGEPFAEVNPSQVQQVLLNLIINARQAMEPGGVLTLKIVEDAEHQVGEITVQDSGSGIPPETLPHIFEKFYTTKTADGHGQGGTGLGLALCKDVIESHQGRIRVETAIGHGTRFTIKLPLVAKPNLMQTATASPESDLPTQRAG